MFNWCPALLSHYWGRVLSPASSATALLDAGIPVKRPQRAFLRLTPKETDALHEVLTWGRQPGNNRILEFFGTTYEASHGACGKIMERFRDVLPEGSRRARIRMMRRESHQPTEGTLDETLGEEACGMVVVDASGHPMKYDC